MKQLFISNRATTMFFSSDNTIEQIAEWIESGLNSCSNPFNLKDPQSCKIVKIVDKYETIIVSGLEDDHAFQLNDIRPIDISQKYI